MTRLPEVRRMVRVDSLVVGDTVEVYGDLGEVVRISGPHRIGSSRQRYWYTLRVLFDGDANASVVGPKAGSAEVACWL